MHKNLVTCCGVQHGPYLPLPAMALWYPWLGEHRQHAQSAHVLLPLWRWCENEQLGVAFATSTLAGDDGRRDDVAAGRHKQQARGAWALDCKA